MTSFWNGRLNKDINNKENVCISDTRMCDHKSLRVVLKSLGLTNNNVKLILFENDPKTCIKNVESKSLSINKISKIYNVDNFSDFDHQIVECFKLN